MLLMWCLTGILSYKYIEIKIKVETDIGETKDRIEDLYL